MKLLERCHCGKSALPKPLELEEGTYYACRCGRVFIGKKHKLDEYVYADPVMDTAKHLKRRGHKVVDL